MQDPLRLALIYGSVRENRFCETLVHWAADRIWSDGRFRLDMIDPKANADATQTIASADAYIVIVPEYNRSYPGPLKSLLDSCYREWHGKAAGFVSYGGASGGVRAVEHLRNVFAELHVVTIRDVVSFANASSQFDAQGCPPDPRAAVRDMTRMLDHLAWWADALRSARRTSLYAELAA